jgi:very-long-chain enoyl-CoA reductase
MEEWYNTACFRGILLPLWKSRTSNIYRFVYAQVLLHFLKREVETLFVHRFSHGTMPFAYIFRKCVSLLHEPVKFEALIFISSFHYHIFGGVFLAYAIYSPTYGASSPYIQGTIRNDPRFLWACTAVWLVSNLLCCQSNPS